MTISALENPPLSYFLSHPIKQRCSIETLADQSSLQMPTGGEPMKRIVLFIILSAGLSGLSWAADPIVGSWKLDVKKSRIAEMPRELTDTYRETAAGTIELSRASVTAQDAAESSTWSWPKEGGIAARLAPDPLPKEISYVPLLIEPGHWYVSVIINGRQSVVMHKTISKDGRILQMSVKGTDTQGKPLDDLYVFERQ